jgi:ABC-type sugar transport system substrate-binding protein
MAGSRKSFLYLVSLSLVLGIALVALAACAPKNAGGQTTGKSVSGKQIKIRYISKKLSDAWFSAEDKGAKLKAAELNVDYVGIDADYNNERCMQSIDSVIAEKVDGVAMTITDPGLSPAAIKKLNEAKIPILAIDDPMVDAAGVAIPYLGVPTYSFGKEGGTQLAKMAKERNFFAAGNKVKVLVLEMATIQTVHETALGFADGLKENLPDLKPANVIFTDVKTGSFDDSISAATATFNANPGVTHWIIACADDYPAFASVKMLIENKFDFKKALISGNGCYQPSLDIFNMGGDIAKSYISTYMDPFLEGQKMIEFFNDLLRKGIALPKDTRVGGGVVSLENWKKFFPEGKMPY